MKFNVSSTFLAQWKQNPRLRIGILVIFAIVWAYGLLLWQDHYAAQLERLQAFNKKIAKTQVVMDQDQWPARLKSVNEQYAFLEKKTVWHETSLGLAQASFQDWLSQTAQKSGLARVVVSASGQASDHEEMPGTTQKNEGLLEPLWKVNAKVVFDFSPEFMQIFLSKLASSEKTVMIDTMSVRAYATPRVELTAIAYFKKAEKE